MSEEFHATYEAGVLRLDQPLGLPDHSRVVGFIVPAAPAPPYEAISNDEFDRELDELSFDAPLLPPDFSRADIYLDHD